MQMRKLYDFSDATENPYAKGSKVGFPEIVTTKKNGSEKFILSGNETDFDVLSFWAWSGSELLGNALRGVLAEFIVSKAIDAIGQVRDGWDSCDLVSTEGIKVEVKSSAYIQSWEQSKHSSISFDIRPTHDLDTRSNQHSEMRKRHSDVYVFCVYAHKEKETANALDLSHWEFYVLPTSVLNEFCSIQKRITLSSLLRLHPTKVSFEKVHAAVLDCFDQQIP